MTNDTDRALLEAAARAAGMFLLEKPWPDVDGWFYCLNHGEHALHFRKIGVHGTYGSPWRPLTDDGDALRLAVKLAERHPGARFELFISKLHDGRGFASAGFFSRDNPSESALEDDIAAATRRAIVRAAAAIDAAAGEKGKA